jgi:hypothetical protein
MRVTAMALALAGLMSACGDDAETSPDGEEEQAAAVVLEYIDALSARDWAGVCDTRTEQDRRELAITAGSCERAFQLLAKARPGLDVAFQDARTGEVRIEGDVASVDVVQPGQTEPATTITAVRENGGWALESRSASRNP